MRGASKCRAIVSGDLVISGVCRPLCAAMWHSVFRIFGFLVEPSPEVPVTSHLAEADYGVEWVLQGGAYWTVHHR